jgi:hypothetical protein
MAQMQTAAAETLKPEDSIDPATGDYWKSNQPQYWEVAARAHRAYAERYSFSEASRAKNLREADECDAKAEALRAGA